MAGSKPQERITFGRRQIDQSFTDTDLYGLIRQKISAPQSITVPFGGGGSATTTAGAGGSFLRKEGDNMIGPLAFNPVVAQISGGIIDVDKVTGFYAPRVILLGEGSAPDDLDTINGEAFQGQLLNLQAVVTTPITLKDATGNILTRTGGDIVIGDGQNITLIFDSISGNWTPMDSALAGGGEATCPVICDENDLGDVTGGVEIDWSLGPFHRMKLVGDITVVMNNLPESPGWHEITVEFLQDNTGGHTVTFLDVFRNDPPVIIRKGTNRYTITKFYSYFTSFDNILQWQPPFLQLTELLSGAVNQGIIHTVLSVDQIANLAVNDHIEFDTVLFTNQMTVTSGGAGQANGIFSGFIPGRTYECTVHISGEGSSNTLNWSARWFDIVGATLIGSEGEQVASTGAVNRDSQVVAKAFFQPILDTDTLEVRITNNSVLTSILNGSVSTEPTTFATIKDCGQTVEQFLTTGPILLDSDGNPVTLEELIDEDIPVDEIPPPPPLIGFNSKMTYYSNFPGNSWGGIGVNGEVVVPFAANVNSFADPTEDPNDTDPPIQKYMCTTPGRLRRVLLNVTENTLTENVDVALMEDDVNISEIFTIPSATAGLLEFPVGGKTAIPLIFGKRYHYRWLSQSGSNPGGNIHANLATEIFWGSA